ncbi:MAG TPA: ABC transporter permease [Terriglobia bacterium]|jgi:phospholipid/cholesterol/gamma-HCH transport system permease protein|nr:ABC transporter permease [Terriglobia bacterium]
MADISIDAYIKGKVQAVQDFTFLLANSIANLFSAPRYVADTLIQMDVIGVGSLPIVLLTGFFTGGVLALQTYRTLSTFGSVTMLGEVVSLSVVRELGPVLTALMVTGRNSSGIASELGSMLVSEQVDAMRALGTDPVRKLVTPRLFAAVITLPILTILADFFGMLGGYFVSFYTVHLTSVEYWTYVYQALTFEDVTQGLLKPFLFAVIIALVGCYFGLTTRGGTEGVGRSTTQAVVVASVLILLVDFFVTKFLIAIHFF